MNFCQCAASGLADAARCAAGVDDPCFSHWGFPLFVGLGLGNHADLLLYYFVFLLTLY
jgi:hypothetical protein